VSGDRFPHPTQPDRSYKWGNHVAPTIAVEGMEHGVLVIDPSISPAGPLHLTDWANALGARSIELSHVGLSQAVILGRQAARALSGQGLDAMVFHLQLGEPPIPELGGSGFCIGPDPPEGASAFARRQMAVYLANDKKLPPAPP
jgi:hypothetical protein